MEGKRQSGVWIISEGRFVNIDLSGICEQPVPGPVTEYNISELARYLLDPNSIAVEEKVVGCSVRYEASDAGLIGRLKRKFSQDKNNVPDGKAPRVEEIISPSRLGFPSFRDEDLNRHFIRINEMLRPYDPARRKIDGLNREKIKDITAVCEDIGGNRYHLNLQGNAGEKISYIMNSISKRVKVVFNKAYLSKGLFEMRGFNFNAFNQGACYRLIKFIQNGQTRHCVLNDGYKLQFWVHDSELITYIHMFEQSLKSDPKLQEALFLCVKGEAKPLKLFFSKKLDQSYTEKYLPLTYRKIFDVYEMNQVEKAAVASMLNAHQSIVSFNYVPRCDTGRQKMCINISVLHDIKALEPIKNRIPQLYSEINKKAPLSDLGRLYLLDSMRGFQYV